MLVALTTIKTQSECFSQAIIEDTICIPVYQLKKSIVDIQKGRYNLELLKNCEKKVYLLEENIKSKDSIIMYSDRMYASEYINTQYYKKLDSLNRIQIKNMNRQNNLNNFKGYVFSVLFGVFGYFIGNR